MVDTKKIIKVSFISLAFIVVILGVLLYILDQGDRKRFEVRDSRQALSKKLVEVCTRNPGECPKNSQELQTLAPDLYRSCNRYEPLQYSYEPSKNHWRLVVNYDGSKVALHDSSSNYVLTGLLYPVKMAREKGVWSK